jgi:hypothetical protein
MLAQSHLQSDAVPMSAYSVGSDQMADVTERLNGARTVQQTAALFNHLVGVGEEH